MAHGIMPLMTDRLTETAEAHRRALADEAEAKEALAAARDRRTAAGEKVAQTRVPLAAAIVEAARAKMRQRDILAAIGDVYTREQVRRICRAAGVEPSTDA